MKNAIKVGFLALTALIIVRCSGSNNSTPVTTGQYYMSNGQCISSTTGQIAASTAYCTNSTGYAYNSSGQCVSTTTGQVAPTTTYCSTSSNGYSYINGQCISTTTGQVAPTTAYCTTGTSTGFTPVTGVGTSGYGGTQCYGLYSWNGQVGQCYGYNCSGYMLISLATGQQVYCQ